jgi:lipooligosaccharide transport system permease protein
MLVLRRSIFSEMLAVVVYPLTLYLAFGVGLRGYIADVEGIPYPVFIAPGLISMTAVTAAFDESAWSMWFHRKVQRTIDEYRVTPITTYDIVIGKILCGLSHGILKGLAVTAVIFIFTPFRFTPIHLMAYLYFIVLGSMIFSCIGTMIGTTIDKPENIGRIQAIIIVPLIFMSGIFFPLTSYPDKVIPIIRLLPTTATFDGARQALLQGEFGPLYALNVAATAAIFFGLAVYIFNRWLEE